MFSSSQPSSVDRNVFSTHAITAFHTKLYRHVASRGLFDSIRTALTPVSIEEDSRGRHLLDALRTEHALPPQPVVAAELPGQGRGLVATCRLSLGQIALTVPLSAIVTPQVALASSQLHRLLFLTQTDSAPLPDWTLLALWLAEITSPELSPPLNASHAAYAAVLPQHTGCVLEWSSEQVGWLKGSYLHRVATDIRTAAFSSWREVSPFVEKAERQGTLPAGVLTEERLRRAFALVLSRTVRLDGFPDLGGEVSIDVLCPWADLVNHDSTSTEYLQWNSSAQAVVLSCDRNYTPGEHVVCSYGPKTDGELLLSYGFIPSQEGSNPHDACLLAVGIQNNHMIISQRDLKRAAMERCGVAQEMVFPLRLAGAPQGLVEWAAFLAMHVEDASEAEQLCMQLLGDIGVGGERVMTPEQRVVGLEAVARLCKETAAGYSIEFEAAKEELALIQQQRKVDSLRAQILRVLIQEHRLLNRTAFLMQTQLREARRTARGRK